MAAQARAAGCDEVMPRIAAIGWLRELRSTISSFGAAPAILAAPRRRGHFHLHTQVLAVSAISSEKTDSSINATTLAIDSVSPALIRMQLRILRAPLQAVASDLRSPVCATSAISSGKLRFPGINFSGRLRRHVHQQSTGTSPGRPLTRSYHADLADRTQRLVVKRRHPKRSPQLFIELPQIRQMRSQRGTLCPSSVQQKISDNPHPTSV